MWCCCCHGDLAEEIQSSTSKLHSKVAMLMLDLTFNTTAFLFATDLTIQLMLYLLQDTLIVLSIVILVISFSSTFVFQAGLISLLIIKFASTIVFSLIYLLLSIALHFYSLHERWTNAEKNLVSKPFIILYVLQRMASILHYFAYKRTILLLSNPKFHQDSEWIRNQVLQQNQQIT